MKSAALFVFASILVSFALPDTPFRRRLCLLVAILLIAMVAAA